LCKKYLYIACTFIKEKQKNLFLMPEIIRKHFVSRQIPDLLFVSFSSIKDKDILLATVSCETWNSH